MAQMVREQFCLTERRGAVTIEHVYQCAVMRSPYNGLTRWHCQQAITAWLNWIHR